ncbi:hypothetical protein E3P81_03769 [Wallemia ichthyophaga]|nr:hypothetical protein E3P97_03805 [Wallemia ichthyophaga]TIB28339.1 hypothetical protein E3P85_03714 [Wallemia ichthyophaga]TIB43892.1 hypothetical protein E3P82_03802 [Wallemia ichthyophaga]TIB46203.1 hypothetical protein E3P81_03769 [Wallemia ichthyophaga]TIB48585.1 hypothetical protein E3P80_03806 [Wallemia ichthyophaga]
MLLPALASGVQATRSLSREDGISEELEQALRIRGAGLIQRAGVLCTVPQATICTAQVIFQRFYYVSSLYNFSIGDIAMGALYLSTKLEETPLGLRDVINVFHRLISTDADAEYSSMSYYGPTYYEWKDSIVVAEMQILKRLGFDVYVQQPYALLINYIKMIDMLNTANIPQRAWSYLNDSLLTPTHVLFSSTTIACACLDLACRDAGVQLPTTSDGKVQWYQLLDCPLEEMECVQLWLLRTYTAIDSKLFADTRNLTNKYKLRDYVH